MAVSSTAEKASETSIRPHELASFDSSDFQTKQQSCRSVLQVVIVSVVKRKQVSVAQTAELMVVMLCDQARNDQWNGDMGHLIGTG